ncbi:hypothetical protein Tco_1034310 [Tanacetum coccineum]
MDDPNLNMEEYIRLEEEKAHKHGKVFNWQTATYGKIRVDDDFHNLSSVEAEFPAIVINDAVVPQDELQRKSQVSTHVNDEIDFRISFDESDDEDYTIFFDKNSFSYKMISVNDLKTDSENDYEKVMPLIPSPKLAINCFDDLDFFTHLENEFPAIIWLFHHVSKDIGFIGGLSDLMAEGLSGRMLMEHCDKASVSVFTSRAWMRMLDIRGPLVYELILEFFSTFRFGQAILDLDTPRTLQFQLGGARRRMSWRQFILALGLYTEEEMQTAGDFLGTTPLYTLIRDPILRLCHRLIACSIARRSQAPKKVTVTDLFYLRGMDVDSVNVPYFLARYLRLFAAGRKSGAHIFGRQFVARLAKNFMRCLMDIGPRASTSAATSTTTSSRQDHALEDGHIRGERARDTPGIDRAARREDSDDDEIDIKQFSGNNVINVDDGAYAHGSNELLEISHGPREGNIDEYWWRIYESGNLEVLES